MLSLLEFRPRIRPPRYRGSSPRRRRLHASAVLALLTLGLNDASAVAREVWYRPPAVRHVERAYAGDRRAQAYLGYLYDKGHGVPQNFRTAAYWYHCAAAAGEPHAQFLLGLAHDRGRGVRMDFVLAYAWINLAVGAAPRGLYNDWSRVRDAVAGKLSLRELTDAQALTFDQLKGEPCDVGLVVTGG